MLKSALLISTLVISSMAQAQIDDPCAYAGIKKKNNFRMDLEEINQALQLSPEKRMKMMCEMKSAILEKYTLVDQKQRRIGLNINDHLAQCAQTEIDTAQSTRSEFFDRAQLCIAALKDTHFSLSTKVERPTVLTAINARYIEKKLVIGSVSTRILEKMKVESNYSWDDANQIFALGNQILTIDGIDAQTAVQKLIPYQSASSAEYAELSAGLAVLGRDYLMPQKRNVTLEIVVGENIRKVTIPWYSSSPRGNPDGIAELQRLGIASLKEVQWRFNSETKKYEQIEEALYDKRFAYSLPLPVNAPMTTMLDDRGAPAVRFAQPIQDRSHAYCYMQLLTFSTRNFHRTAGDAGSPFTETIAGFVSDCESKQLPLLLDIRANNGGNGNLPGELLSVLAKGGQVLPRDIDAARLTQANINLLSMYLNPDDGGDINHDEFPAEEFMQDLNASLKAKKTMTNLWLGPKLEPMLPTGYNQPIVALVTSACISACDKTAAFLKNSGRAKLLGTASNGTGAGFSSWGNFDSNFTDSEGIMDLRIPNHLFGITKGPVEDTNILDAAVHEELLTENKPAVADIIRETAISDIYDGNRGYLKQALTELFK